jgi:hypothetical protein
MSTPPMTAVFNALRISTSSADNDHHTVHQEAALTE